MRNLIFLIAGFLIFNLPLEAQIIEKDSNMSLGVQRGNEMILTDIEDKDAADLWEEYFEDRYDGKVKRNRRADEYYVTGVRINSIFSVSNIDLYTRFEERGSNTLMTLWVDLGMSFVNSTDYATEYQGVINLMEDFRIYARTYVVNKEYEEAEEALEDLKEDLDKLNKQNGKLHEKVDDYQQKILEAKADIDQNLVDQQEMKLSIDRQIEVLKQIQVKQENIKKMK